MPDGFPDGSEGKASACNEGNPEDTGDAGSIPGSGRFPGEGNGNSLQHSWVTVLGSHTQTRLGN